jgi:hypothetical protein
MRAFSEKMREDGWYVFWAAPTGKAASRISQVTGEPASTLHSLLYRRVTEGRKGQPLFGDRRQTLIDGRKGLLVIDEACLDYHSRVILSDGSWEYIGKIVNQRLSLEVMSWNKDTGAIEPKKIIGWSKYKSSGCILNISASHVENRERQRRIRCTDRHKIYLPDGTQRMASELNVGDKVLVRGTFLSPAQRSFLLGSLLGDCSVSGDVGKVVKFVHGKCQLPYLEYKRRIFPGGEIYSANGGYRPDKQVYGFSTPRIDDLDEIRSMAYPGGKKEVCREWLDMIDEIGLAAWYMDDGHLERRTSGYTKKDGSPGSLSFDYLVHLHTEGFSEKSCLIILDWLKDRWGLEASIDRPGGRMKVRLHASSSEKFLLLVRRFIIPCMSYKIPASMSVQSEELAPQQYLNVGPFEITSKEAETKWKNQANVFDIEVDGNHNYFGGNILVSNSMVGKRLYDDLVAAAGTTASLLFVGDREQVEPVADLLGPDLDNPTAELTTVHRQALESPILLVATEVRSGQRMRQGIVGNQYERRRGSAIEASEWICERLRDNRDAVVLCATNTVRRAVNKLSRQELGFAASICPGEQLVVGLNNRDMGKMNGEILRVEAVSPVVDEEGEESGLYRVFADGEVYFVHGPSIGEEVMDFKKAQRSRVGLLRNTTQWLHVDYGYALTVHRGQGSEWAEVCFLVDNKLKFRAGLDPTHVRRLAYTAITRAKKSLLILDV